jgi:hypothetical protein
MAAISFEKDAADDDISAACVKKQTLTKDRVALTGAMGVQRSPGGRQAVCH